MTARIVVAVDGSTPSRAALVWSVDYAAQTGIDLVVLHVVDHQLDHLSDAATAAALGDSERFVRAEAEFARARNPAITVTAELMRGEPFAALVATSRTAVLLVVGTHKTGFIHGRSMGSRFVELATMAYCPVAYIPNVSLTSRRGVVVALDDSATGRRAIRFAAGEADRLGQNLTLVYAEASRERVGESESEHREREQADLGYASTVLSRAVDSTRAEHAGLATRSRTSLRGTARELIDASLTSSLVVICHPQARLSTGSDAGMRVHDVLMNLGGPVIVVPRDETSDRDDAR